jgi:tetratricopeptide (TPR) repeat protein
MRRRARILARAAALASLLSAWSSTYAEGSYTIERANGYVNAHDWDGLLRFSTEWTKTEPNEPMAWFYLGNTYAQALKQPNRTLPAFERAVALRPKWPEAWNALGFVNVELKRYDEAAKAFTYAVERAPRKANYWNSLAAMYSYQNRLSLAVKTLEDEQHAIAGSSVFVDWYNLGNGLCTMQEFPLAAAAYRRAIQLKPDYGPVWNNLGTIEGVAGNTQAARNDYQRASALGDEAGATNYARLRQAIAAERERTPDLLHQLCVPRAKERAKSMDPGAWQ